MDNIKIRDRGLLINYAPMGTHKDVIYFATDTLQLILNGSVFSGVRPIIVRAVNVDDNTLDGFPSQILFNVETDDFNKIFGSGPLDTLIVLFDEPVTEYNLTHFFFKYLKDEPFETDNKKLWTLESPFLVSKSVLGELITYPTYMNCAINFDTTEDYKNLHNILNQINSEATEIQESWTAKEGSNYTSESKDITTAIYDLDNSLKTEELTRIELDNILTEKYESLKDYTDNIKEPHVIKITSIPFTVQDNELKLEIRDAYTKECPIFIEYTSNDLTISFRADTFILNSGVLESFKASVVNTPTNRPEDKITPDNDFTNEIYSINIDLSGDSISIELELTRLNEVKNKVDKVEDHQLSEEDFTHLYRQLLDELIEGLRLIDFADTDDAKIKLNLALNDLTVNEPNVVQKFNRWNYIFNSKVEIAPIIDNNQNRPEITTYERCEYKVTSLEYLGNGWVVTGASTVHQKGNRFFSKFSYIQSSSTLTISFHEITPASIGLGLVDNTADVDKPISNAVNTRITDEITGLHIEWDTSGTLIKLLNKDNTILSSIDASDFVRDGMIESVDIVGDSIVLTFNLAAGGKTINLPLSKLVNIYEGEKAISIDDASRLIKLIIDPTDNNYLINSTTGLRFNDSSILSKFTEITGSVSSIQGNYVKKTDLASATENGLLTKELFTKLQGISSGAEVNVQADWNETTNTSDAYIKNKPTSMPASDVYAWAKAANKPTYTYTEILNTPTILAITLEELDQLLI